VKESSDLELGWKRYDLSKFNREKEYVEYNLGINFGR
jgi:hypothetical protein